MFKGDGRAVPISTQQANAHAMEQQNNRVSFDSGVAPSYPKKGSSSSSYLQSPSISTPQRQQSTDSQASDSGLPPSYPRRTSSSSSFHQQSPSVFTPHRHSGIDHQMDAGQQSSSPYNHQQPPPVDLNSHPSRRHSFRSSASVYENVDSDSGIGSCSSSSRRGSTMTELTDGEQFHLDTEDDPNGGTPIRSETDPGGVVTRHPTFCNAKSTQSHYQVPPIRSHTVSSPRPSLHSSDYEKMIHPKGNGPALQAQVPDDQYIQMRPAPTRSNSLRSVSDSPPTTKVLHPIKEGRVMNDRRPLNYENTTFHSSVQEHEFEYYVPKYENLDQFKEKRHSFNGRSSGPTTNSNVRTVESTPPSPPVIIPTP